MENNDRFVLNEEQKEIKGNGKRIYTTTITLTGETEKAYKFTQVKITEAFGRITKTQRSEWFPKSVLKIEGNTVIITNSKFYCKAMFY